METENMVKAADSDNFLIQHTDFSLREQVNYPNGGISRFYDNGIDMVIIFVTITRVSLFFLICLSQTNRTVISISLKEFFVS